MYFSLEDGTIPILTTKKVEENMFKRTIFYKKVQLIIKRTKG